MQLELSNFQPLAANEEEAPDLAGAEQLSEPIIEESDQGLASLIRSVGLTSITDIESLVSELLQRRTLDRVVRGRRRRLRERNRGHHRERHRGKTSDELFHACPPFFCID